MRPVPSSTSYSTQRYGAAGFTTSPPRSGPDLIGSGAPVFTPAVTKTWSPQTTGELHPTPGMAVFQRDVLGRAPSVWQGRIVRHDASVRAAELRPVLLRGHARQRQHHETQRNEQPSFHSIPPVRIWPPPDPDALLPADRTSSRE